MVLGNNRPLLALIKAILCQQRKFLSEQLALLESITVNKQLWFSEKELLLGYNR